MAKKVRHVMLIDTSLGGMAIASGALSSVAFIRRCSSIDILAHSMESSLPLEVSRIWHDHKPSKVVVSVGPGPFTSLRISLALCRGLVANPQDLIGVSSLLGMVEVLAEERETPCRLYLSITDDFGVVAEAGGDDSPSLNTIDLNNRESAPSGIIIDSWTRLAKLIDDEKQETIDKMATLDYGLQGLALLARRQINTIDNSWPRPLYMRSPYPQLSPKEEQ